MLDKFLKEVISNVVGKQAEDAVELLSQKKYINEFIIAKKLNLTINQTRNILYRLADNGLVSSVRKKDKKKGWYTYFWKIEILKSLEFLRALKEKRVEQIQNQIKSRETKQFYVCDRCNVEFNEENALLYDFTCTECGSTFSLKDNSKVLKELERNLDKFKKEIEFLDKEISIEREKLDKIKHKDEEKLKKQKTAERKATREKNKKEAARQGRVLLRASAKKKEKRRINKLNKKKIKKSKPKKSSFKKRPRRK